MILPTVCELLIYIIDDHSFLECKTLFKHKEYLQNDINSLGKKFVELRQNCDKYKEPNVCLETYQSEIVNLTEKEYEPISTKVFDDVYEVLIIRNLRNIEGIRNSGCLLRAVKFIEKMNRGGYFVNSGLVNQISIPEIKPIFSFGFSPKTIIELLQRQINLMISVNLRKLNKRLETQGKIWRIDEKIPSKIVIPDSHSFSAHILFPWTSLLNECITIDSFIEWVDGFIKRFSQMKEYK